MRMITKTIAALGFVGVMAAGASSPTFAQGIYFQGPGIEFGIGRPYYRDWGYRDYRYRDYDGAYAYSYYDRPHFYYRDGRRDRRNRRDWDED